MFNLSTDKVTGSPIPVANQEVIVDIDPQLLLHDYAANFVSEGYRKHPLLAKSIALTAEEVSKYAEYLLESRIQHVNGNRRDFREQQLLFVPAWIEYTISQVGVYVNKAQGLTFVPAMKASDISLDEAREISNKIRAFEGTLQVVTSAFPNHNNGDEDLMTTAVITDYVRSPRQMSHPLTSYLTAFLGMKLREENVFGILYRVQYDDIEYLRRALDSEGANIC